MSTKTQSAFRFQRRWLLIAVLALTAIVCVIPVFRARAQNPASGSVGPKPGGASAAWDQTVITPGGGVNTEAACVDGVNCEVFTLNVTGTPSD
jgi:hypothetical protein